MEENRKKADIKLLCEKIILIFIGCQVLIDLLTTVTTRFVKTSLSVGMVTRFAFVGFGIIYILAYGSKKAKVLLAAVCALFAGQLAYAVYGLEGGFFLNARYYLRAMTFPVSVLVFGSLFVDKEKDEHTKELFEKFMMILNFLIFSIGIVYILSMFSGFSVPMYEDGRIGTSAWFLSGNEMASSMIIMSGIPIYCYCKKQTWYNLVTVFLQLFIILMIGTKASLVILASTMVLILYTLIRFIMRKQYNRTHLAIMFATLAVLCVFYKEIPAIKNILTQQEIVRVQRMYTSQKEGGSIPEEISTAHAQVTPEYDGRFTSSLTITKADDVLRVSGYFYPYYYDLRHPNYVTKKLVLMDRDDNRTEVVLTDTYNPNIVLPEGKEGVYSTVFGGFKGELPDTLVTDQVYRVYMEVLVDGEFNSYRLLKNIKVNFGTKYDRLAVYKDNVIRVSLNPDYVEPSEENVVEAPKDTGTGAVEDNEKRTTLASIILSGRNLKLNNVLRQIDVSWVNNLFGYGYVGNYEIGKSTGLEMDYVEIFVSFGIIGGIIFLTGFYYLIITGLYKGIKRNGIKLIFREDVLSLLLSVLLSIGSSFLAGHTLLMPSVSIKVALVTSLLYYCCTAERDNTEAEEEGNA